MKRINTQHTNPPHPFKDTCVNSAFNKEKDFIKKKTKKRTLCKYHIAIAFSIWVRR